VGKLEWEFITPWNCTPTRLVPLLKNLWSQTWDRREVAEGGCCCEFKSPCQRKPRLGCCLRQIALQCCGSANVVDTLKQSASSQGNTRVFLLLSGKILMGKLERNTLCLQGYSNVEVKTEKKVFELEPQSGSVLWQWRWSSTHSFLCIRCGRRTVRVYVVRSRMHESEGRVCKVGENRNITPWSPKVM